jgi:hypothetical protein
LEAEVRTHTHSLGDRAATKLGAVDRSAIALKMKLGVNPRALIILFYLKTRWRPPNHFSLFLFLLLLFWRRRRRPFESSAQPRKKRKTTKNDEKSCYFLGYGDAWGTLIIAIVCVSSRKAERRGGRGWKVVLIFLLPHFVLI